MTLFRCQAPTRIEQPSAACIQTPLGTVQLGLEVERERLVGDNATQMFSVGDGGRLWVWRRPSMLAELLVCRPTLNLPSNLTVDDCWSAI